MIAPIVAHAESQLEAIERALADLAEIRAVVTSQDGTVIVEADATGALVGLWIDEALGPDDAEDLGPRIVVAARSASAMASAQRDHVLAGLTAKIASRTDVV